jgi:hypothetical protein
MQAAKPVYRDRNGLWRSGRQFMDFAPLSAIGWVDQRLVVAQRIHSKDRKVHCCQEEGSGKVL